MTDMNGVERDACEHNNRALLIVASGCAIATLVPVALHQLGVLEHLPDPPASVFDSDGITESKMAHPFGIPDGLLGLASYTTTLTLALLAQESLTVQRLLGGKLLLDGGAAAFNASRQVVRFGKLCSWCMGTVLSTAVMVYAGRRIIANTICGFGARRD